MSEQQFNEWLRDQPLPMVDDKLSLPKIETLLRTAFDAGRLSALPDREGLAEAISDALMRREFFNVGNYNPGNWLPIADAILVSLTTPPETPSDRSTTE